MPRFHFHVHDGRNLPDEEGTVLRDAQVASFQAIRFAGEILKDDADRVMSNGGWRLEVTDDAGLVLFQMGFLVDGWSTLRDEPGSGS
ncbi:hypothetical protein FV242_21795 [Methylobacterium sp. WL64]|uniref:DUF6894 family protein n=1 Tax=Methylobacterium sp. WL64 TaxID=2603894 RepID=UPI0011CAF334|nr:hypothetical protein [Methylobacterium sp. WL64]TXN00475.1 hypothetical protein FV242_21795 [Methylobacterium sp. WL64]